jgi:hypothetical protein
MTVSADSGGGGEGRDNVFQSWQIQHLHIELRNESQMALLAGQNGNRNTSQSCQKWFVISPKLKRSSFTKMAKMPNYSESCQQFTEKSGVGLEKKSKRSPMVSRFLLHDPSDMSIGGISGKRKLNIWGGMLEGHRHCEEVFYILECLLCRGGPLQHPGPPPPPPRGQGTGFTLLGV